MLAKYLFDPTSVNGRPTMNVQYDIGWSAQSYIGCAVVYNTKVLVFCFRSPCFFVSEVLVFLFRGLMPNCITFS